MVTPPPYNEETVSHNLSKGRSAPSDPRAPALPPAILSSREPTSDESNNDQPGTLGTMARGRAATYLLPKSTYDSTAPGHARHELNDNSRNVPIEADASAAIQQETEYPTANKARIRGLLNSSPHKQGAVAEVDQGRKAESQAQAQKQAEAEAIDQYLDNNDEYSAKREKTTDDQSRNRAEAGDKVQAVHDKDHVDAHADVDNYSDNDISANVSCPEQAIRGQSSEECQRHYSAAKGPKQVPSGGQVRVGWSERQASEFKID